VFVGLDELLFDLEPVDDVARVHRAVGLDHRVYGIGHGPRGHAALGAGARSGGGQERQE
jgi:hypothetical protein